MLFLDMVCLTVAPPRDFETSLDETLRTQLKEVEAAVLGRFSMGEIKDQETM
jgi:hypothetical protein